MKNFQGSQMNLDVSLSKLFSELLDDVNCSTKSARTPVAVPPNDELVLKEEFYFKINTLEDSIFFILLGHYGNFPVNFRWKYQFDLVLALEKTSFIVMSKLVTDKDFLLEWLRETQIITSREFFGKYHDRSFWYKKLLKLKVIKLEKKIHPRRTIRRRGYRDKGTLASPDEQIRRKEVSADIWLSELQLSLEDQEDHRLALLSKFKEFRGNLGNTPKTLKSEFFLERREEDV